MTPSEVLGPGSDAVQPPTRWGWPVWERDEVLREQVALLRQNFPMTLLASLATALGTLWVMARVTEPEAITVWLVSHALVVAGCISPCAALHLLPTQLGRRRAS